MDFFWRACAVDYAETVLVALSQCSKACGNLAMVLDPATANRIAGAAVAFGQTRCEPRKIAIGVDSDGTLQEIGLREKPR